MTVHNIDCNDFLTNCIDENKKFALVFGDPPDNLNASYNTYVDRLPAHEYYAWIETLLQKSLRISDCVWISYYFKHDLEIKHLIRNLLKYQYPTVECKTFIWSYRFGQYNSHDCGSAFRFLVRLMRKTAPLYPEAILEESVRQQMGDARADDRGRVPSDFWNFDIPRVTGNALERRPWHITQHPEKLIERIVKLSTKEGDSVLDLFAGSGTVERVCKRLNRVCDSIEIDKFYADKINEETNNA